MHFHSPASSETPSSHDTLSCLKRALRRGPAYKYRSLHEARNLSSHGPSPGCPTTHVPVHAGAYHQSLHSYQTYCNSQMRIHEQYENDASSHHMGRIQIYITMAISYT